MAKEVVSFDDLEAENQGEQSPQLSQEGQGASVVPPQETPPEPEEVIPEVDERGVPAKNVLAEIRRKVDAGVEENRKLREELALLRTQREAPPSAVAQQPVTPRDESEVLQQIEKEVDEAIAQGKIASGGQLIAYVEHRKRQLMPQPDINQVVQQHIQVLTKRGASESRAIAKFPDLQISSPLSQAVLNEVQSRERENPKFRDKNPHYLEEITYRIADQMGIKPKSENGNSATVRERMSAPAVEPGSRAGVRREEVVTPTEADKHLAPYFKSDPAEIAKARKQQQANPKVFSFPEV